MKKEGEIRLRQLQRVLLEVDEEKFDIKVLVAGPRNAKGELKCFSKGCALGWMATDEWFKKDGVSIPPLPSPHSTAYVDTADLTWQVYFGITRNACHILFGNKVALQSDNCKPADVALNIERILLKMRPIPYTESGLERLRIWGRNNRILQNVRKRVARLKAKQG